MFENNNKITDKTLFDVNLDILFDCHLQHD